MNEHPTNIEAAPVFDDNEAAVVDTFVVPSYLHHFWQCAERMVLVGEGARVAHLGSLTGFPANQILSKMPNTTGVGVDSSDACVALANQKLPQELFSYKVADPAHSELPGGAFSHVLLLHPQGSAEARRGLFSEAARLLYAGGQLVVSLPLSRSFPEIIDLIDEFALKYDDATITSALQKAAEGKVTIEAVSDELELAGFHDIDFDVQSKSLSFDSGREFLDDPSVRYFIAPQLEAWLDQADLAAALEYVGRAIDKYWSDSKMELGFTVAALSARR